MSTCRIGTDLLGGSRFGYCIPCEWTGPWRRWAWQARRDTRRHERYAR